MRCFNCHKLTEENAIHNLFQESLDRVTEYYGLIRLEGPDDMFEEDGTVIICDLCVRTALLQMRTTQVKMTPDEPRYSWTQPICTSCYKIRYPDRLRAAHLVEPETETCVDCGEKTLDGLYIRIDPTTANHPTNLKED